MVDTTKTNNKNERLRKAQPGTAKNANPLMATDEDLEILAMTERTLVVPTADEETISLNDIMSDDEDELGADDLTGTPTLEDDALDLIGDEVKDIQQRKARASALNETAEEDVLDLMEAAEEDVVDLIETADEGVVELTETAEEDVLDLMEAAEEDVVDLIETADEGVVALTETAEEDVLDLMEAAEADALVLSEAVEPDILDLAETVEDDALELTESSLAEPEPVDAVDLSEAEDEGEMFDLRNITLDADNENALAAIDDFEEVPLTLTDDDEDLLDMTEDVDEFIEDEFFEDDEAADEDLLKMSETTEFSSDDIDDLCQKTVAYEDIADGKPAVETAGVDASRQDSLDLDQRKKPAETPATGTEPQIEEEALAALDDQLEEVPLEMAETVELADIMPNDGADENIPAEIRTPSETAGPVQAAEENGAFSESLETELESALDLSQSESDIEKIISQGKVSARVHNRQEIDIPADFDSETIHAWHEGVRKKMLEAGSGLVSEKQLEDALVRVIKETYAEKLEKMIEETVEKTIRQEIDKLTKLLSAND